MKSIDRITFPFICTTMLLAVALLWPLQASAQFSVADRSPGSYTTTASPADPVIIEFSQDVDFGTVTNGIRFHASVSGSLTGSFTLLDPNRVSFTPLGGFSGGEKISVTITEDLLSSGGVPASPEQWVFYIAPEYGSDRFSETEILNLEDGSEPSGILAVDLTNNFMPDLIVVNSNNETVTVFENRNHLNEGFQEVSRINTGVASKILSQSEALTTAQSTTLPTNSSITTGDLNGNGFSDAVVAATLTNQLILLKNSADGQPDLTVELISTGERPVKVVASDLNNNGSPDLAVASAGTDRVYIHFNNGDGTFAAPMFIDTGLAPLTLAVEDINGSGLPDIIVPLSGENSVIALINQGAGNFTQQLLLDELTYTPSFITTGNIVQGSGTNEPDIVLGSSDETTMFVYRNDSATFTLTQTLSQSDLSRPIFAIAEDFTANGVLDLLSSHFSSGDLLLNLNAPGGASFAGQTVLDQIPGPVGLTSADLNFSGSLDIAVTNFTTGQVTILYNDERRPDCLASAGFDFGDVCLFETAEQNIPIENVCSFPLEVSVDVVGEGFETSVTAFEIAPGEIFSLPVSFTPEDRRNYSGNIIAEYIREGGVFTEEVQFPLSGRGVIAELTVPESVSFGDVDIGDTATRQVQIQNTGDVETSFTLQIESGDGIFSISGSIDFTLAAGEQVSVPIEFMPQSVQNYSDELVIFSESDCGNEEYRVQLSGTGVDPPPPLPDLVAVSIEPASGTNEFTYGETYFFEGVLRLDGELTVSDWFNVVFLVNNQEAALFRNTETLNPGNIRTFILEFAFLQEGTNTITFVVDSDDEIEESDTTNNEVSITIDIERGRLAVSPNPFTPNNDGFNDDVEFDFEQVGNITNPVIRIFSFNGKLVRTLSALNGTRMLWDGLDENGNRLNPGVYLYVVQENNQLIGRGSITLAL